MAKKLAEITESLVDSFHKHGGINHLDGTNLPSRDAVVDITRDLLRLVFPGFYDKDPIRSAQIGNTPPNLSPRSRAAWKTKSTAALNTGLASVATSATWPVRRRG